MVQDLDPDKADMADKADREAHNPADDEFGDDRLKGALARNAHLPVDEMSSEILKELKTWMADAPQFDDLTFILMKVA